VKVKTNMHVTNQSQGEMMGCVSKPKIVSLWRLMQECDIWGLAMLLRHIDEARSSVKAWADGGERNDIISEQALELFVRGNLITAQSFATRLKLQATYNRVWEGGGHFHLISTHLTWAQLYNELTVLRQAIESDLEEHLFVQVMPEKAQQIDLMSANWETVWTAIPDAKTDIVEAVHCYALERNTACVFHSMRVAEWGLRAFCSTLGFTGVKATQKSGQFKVTPVEYATWESILSQLRPYAKQKSDSVKNLARRQQLREFYHSAISEVEGFKDAWRNHVMHTHRFYSAEDAAAVLTHVRRFMILLVSNGVLKHRTKP
jgi:hypothetical protein